MTHHYKIALFIALGVASCFGMVCFVGTEVKASATPSPAPTARAATSTEQAAFLKFAPTRTGWKLDGGAVAGPYAVFGIYNQYSGQTGLAYDENGQWVKKILTGGQFIPSEFSEYLPGIMKSTARALYNLEVKQVNSGHLKIMYF